MWSGDPLGGPEVFGRPSGEVRKWSGDLPGGPELVGRPPGGPAMVGTPYLRFGNGPETIWEVL